MNQLPPIVFLAPVIGLVVVVAMTVLRKRALQGHDAQWSQYRASELATRLRLTLVKGDPTFNFFIRQAHADVSRGPSDGKPIHIEVLLEGAPDGHDVTLRYLYRVEQETGLAKVTWRTWFDCRMEVRAKQAFPRFEVRSRNAPMGPINRTLPLAAVATGDRALDEKYEVLTGEQGIADVLRAELPAFSRFDNAGVHLVGDGQTVAFVMQNDKAPLLANALYYAEDMQRLLTKLAVTLGG